MILLIRPGISEKSDQNRLAEILGKILITKSYQADWVNLKLISVVVYFRLKQFPLRARQIHHQFEVRVPKRWVISGEGYSSLRSFPVKFSSGHISLYNNRKRSILSTSLIQLHLLFIIDTLETIKFRSLI